jgi:hypothetical protein
MTRARVAALALAAAIVGCGGESDTTYLDITASGHVKFDRLELYFTHQGGTPAQPLMVQGSTVVTKDDGHVTVYGRDHDPVADTWTFAGGGGTSEELFGVTRAADEELGGTVAVVAWMGSAMVAYAVIDSFTVKTGRSATRAVPLIDIPAGAQSNDGMPPGTATSWSPGVQVWPADRSCLRITDESGTRFFVTPDDADCDGLVDERDCVTNEYCDADAPSTSDADPCNFLCPTDHPAGCALSVCRNLDGSGAMKPASCGSAANDQLGCVADCSSLPACADASASTSVLQNCLGGATHASPTIERFTCVIPTRSDDGGPLYVCDYGTNNPYLITHDACDMTTTYALDGLAPALGSGSSAAMLSSVPVTTSFPTCTLDFEVTAGQIADSSTVAATVTINKYEGSATNLPVAQFVLTLESAIPTVGSGQCANTMPCTKTSTDPTEPDCDE